jgi:hypothetical protein
VLNPSKFFSCFWPRTLLTSILRYCTNVPDSAEEAQRPADAGG